MGVPSCCLCWLHNSGVSTPSVFSQSKNTLGLTLNHLEISFPRPNLKAIFSLFLSPYRIYTQTHTSPLSIVRLTPSTPVDNNCYKSARPEHRDLTADLQIPTNYSITKEAFMDHPAEQSF